MPQTIDLAEHQLVALSRRALATLRAALFRDGGPSAAAYLQEAGWGTIAVSSLNDAVIAIDSDDWGEADPESDLEHPGCHLTTGMFADFFGRVSDLSLAVLEVECRSMGAPRCRFLLGNGEVMHFLYSEMERGAGYEEAVGKVE